MTTTQTQLYAELLPNIRQVSVSASLASPVDASTAAEVLRDGVTLRVRHAGAVEELTLPSQVAAGGSRLSIPPAKPQPGVPLSGYVTWRLPLAGDARHARGSSADDLAPWSAPDLRPGSKVVCRSCEAVVVAQSLIKAWKDLPSDNWAEMMEFWHCHKPDHGHPQDGENGEAGGTDLADRGYGANSLISAESGVGFVDLITLLFSESDCQGLLFSVSTFEKASAERESVFADGASETAAPRGLNVFCASCRSQIGYFNLRMQSVNLFKWQVYCASNTTLAPSIADCVAATLVATISRTGSSKSIILPIYDLPEVDSGSGSGKDSGGKVLQVWVLNSSICYASSRRMMPTLAIKLLYKHIERKEADDILDKLNSDVQEINLPAETITAVTKQLEVSNGILPSRERLFKEWKIGLVERWDPSKSRH